MKNRLPENVLSQKSNNLFMKNLFCHRFIFILSLIIPFLITGCHKKTAKINYEEANKLFDETVDLISNHIQQMDEVNDSVMYYKIIDDFDEKITKINYRHPPETDYLLSEEENDSLQKLMTKYLVSQEKAFERINRTLKDTIN